MADITVSPNMSLPVPTVSTDFGPDWATNLVACLSSIDSHNHTSGQGVAIPPSGLNINASLPMGNNSLTNTKAVIFTTQASFATNQSVYVSGVDLYYNDGSGNVVRITQSGSVSGSTGTITGLPSGTASASYQSVGGTFQFQSATNTPANISGATLLISEQTTSPNFISIKSPTSLAAAYNFTLPAALPAATKFMTLSSAGAVGATIAYPLTGSDIASATITGSNIAAGTITASNITNATITGTQIASNVSLAGNGVKAGSQYVITSSVNGSAAMTILRARFDSDGSSSGGEGFNSTKTGTGAYTVTFNTAFGDIPMVTATAIGSSARTILVSLVDTSQVQFSCFNASGSSADANVNLIAIGLKA